MRKEPPAVLAQDPRGRVHADRSPVEPELRGARALVERAAGELRVHALVAEAVLHRDGEGASQRVQAEEGTAAQQVNAADRDVGYQVPVDAVAERLVDAHAVLVDRNSLRRAEHRGRLEAAVEDVGLERVGECVVESDAAELSVHCPEQVRRSVAREVGGRKARDVAGNLVDVNREARNRSRADDDDLRELRRRRAARRQRSRRIVTALRSRVVSIGRRSERGNDEEEYRASAQVEHRHLVRVLGARSVDELHRWRLAA